MYEHVRPVEPVHLAKQVVKIYRGCIYVQHSTVRQKNWNCNDNVVHSWKTSTLAYRKGVASFPFDVLQMRCRLSYHRTIMSHEYYDYQRFHIRHPWLREAFECRCTQFDALISVSDFINNATLRYAVIKQRTRVGHIRIVNTVNPHLTSNHMLAVTANASEEPVSAFASATTHH